MWRRRNIPLRGDYADGADLADWKRLHWLNQIESEEIRNNHQRNPVNQCNRSEGTCEKKHTVARGLDGVKGVVYLFLCLVSYFSFDGLPFFRSVVVPFFRSTTLPFHHPTVRPFCCLSDVLFHRPTAPLFQCLTANTHECINGIMSEHHTTPPL